MARELMGTLTDARTPAVGERIGPFRVLRELGRGGMAIVYRAERADGAFEQQVALKWMRAGDAGADERLRHERQILARLRHAHIARLLDGGRSDDGISWFAMELIEGVAIDRWCVERAVPRAGVLDLFDQVADAVSFAHAHLLVHRDIKPSNILVDADGSAKLLDFGIAAITDTADDTVRGFTPGWASPEQRRGDTVGVASDIYQLGLLLRHLLRREVGIAGSETAARATGAEPPGAHAVRAEAPIPERPLAAIIDRSLAEDPSARYASVEELRSDVRAWREHRPVRAHDGGTAYRLALFARRNAWASAVAVVAAALLIATSVAFTWRLAGERDSALREAHKATAVREFVVSMLQTANPGLARGKNLTVREVLAQGEQRVDHELADEPELQAIMLQTIADVYFTLGDWAAFERLNARAIGLLDAMPDVAPALLAARLREQARSISVRGEPEAALPWLDRAFGVLHDPSLDPALYSRLIVSRSAILDRLGRHEEADALTRQAYEVALTHLGPENAATVYARNNVIWLMIERGENEAALRALQDSIATLQRLPEQGPLHTETLTHRVTLAELLLAMGRFDEARGEIDAVMPLHEQVLGAGHMRMGRALAVGARAALNQGEYSAASAMLGQARNLKNLDQLALAGRVDLELAESLLAIAEQRPVDAIQRLEPALAAKVGDPMERVEMRLALARALCAQQDTAGAAEQLRQAPQDAARLGPNNPQRRRMLAVGADCTGFAAGPPYP